jgi:hypothetical protein
VLLKPVKFWPVIARLAGIFFFRELTIRYGTLVGGLGGFFVGLVGWGEVRGFVGR